MLGAGVAGETAVLIDRSGAFDLHGAASAALAGLSLSGLLSPFPFAHTSPLNLLSGAAAVFNN